MIIFDGLTKNTEKLKYQTNVILKMVKNFTG